MALLVVDQGLELLLGLVLVQVLGPGLELDLELGLELDLVLVPGNGAALEEAAEPSVVPKT